MAVAPPLAFGALSLPKGEASADAAASNQSSARSVDSTADLGDHFLRFSYSQPDTTTFEFPEEEREHLIRDISIFLIASVFIAFFIVKVFIEDDDEVVEEGPPGKDIP